MRSERIKQKLHLEVCSSEKLNFPNISF